MGVLLLFWGIFSISWRRGKFGCQAGIFGPILGFGEGGVFFSVARWSSGTFSKLGLFRVRFGVLGGVGVGSGRLPGRVPFLCSSEQGQSPPQQCLRSRSSSPSRVTLPSTPSFPGSFRSSLRSSFGESGLTGALCQKGT